MPPIATKIGERGCVHDFIDTLMPWLDDRGAGYLGWTWNPWDCSAGPAPSKDCGGTPTAFGQGLKDHLAALPPPASAFGPAGPSAAESLRRPACAGPAPVRTPVHGRAQR